MWFLWLKHLKLLKDWCKNYEDELEYTFSLHFLQKLKMDVNLTLTCFWNTISAYDVFAICEYLGVFLNIAYHGCAFYDIRYKVIFSVRLVEAAQFSENYPKRITWSSDAKMRYIIKDYDLIINISSIVENVNFIKTLEIFRCFLKTTEKFWRTEFCFSRGDVV